MSVCLALPVPLAQVSDVRHSLYHFDPLIDPRWDKLIETHPRASLFHSTQWISALRDVYGYEPVAFSTCGPSEPLTNAIICCRVRSRLTGSRIVSLPFSDHCDILVKDGNEANTLLSLLKDSMGKNWHYLEIRPQPSTLVDSSVFGASITYFFHRLDLRKSLDTLFDGFHKDCVKRKIARAEREGLQDEVGCSDVQLKKFYELFVRSRQRLGLPPQPFSWFRDLRLKFGDSLQIRLASKDGLPIASILTLRFRDKVVYKYGCSDIRYNRLGSMPLLFWKAIQDAKQLGMKELDLGRSDPDSTGLITFKARLGATGSLGSYWRFPAPRPLRLERTIKPLLKAMFRATPVPILTGIGQLLYPHIG